MTSTNCAVAGRAGRARRRRARRRRRSGRGRDDLMDVGCQRVCCFCRGVVRPAALRVRAVGTWVVHTRSQGGWGPATCMCAFRPLRWGGGGALAAGWSQSRGQVATVNGLTALEDAADCRIVTFSGPAPECHCTVDCFADVTSDNPCFPTHPGVEFRQIEEYNEYRAFVRAKPQNRSKLFADVRERGRVVGHNYKSQHLRVRDVLQRTLLRPQRTKFYVPLFKQ
jgi:hypothetical protein